MAEMTAFDLGTTDPFHPTVEVRGEAFRLDELAKVGGHLAPGGTLEFTAILVPDPTNEHDRNAIAVHCLEPSAHVGFIAREVAAEYSAVSVALSRLGAAANCPATLYRLTDGGYDVALRLLPPQACLERLREKPGSGGGGVERRDGGVPGLGPIEEGPRRVGLAGKLFVGGLFILPIGIVIGAIIGGLGRPRPQAPATPPPTTMSAIARNQMLFLDNHRGNDRARSLVFRDMLRNLKQRCDSIDRAIMGKAGQWTVECSPGYRYAFTFNDAGEPVSAFRVP